jgi:hypothetical protein
LLVLLYVEWGLGFLCQFFIARLMRSVGAHRQFPAFYCWMIFEFAKSPVLIMLFHLGTRETYFLAYWSAQVVGYLFEFAVCYNIFADACSNSRLRGALLGAMVWSALIVGYAESNSSFVPRDGMLQTAVRLARGSSIVLVLWFFCVVVGLKVCRAKMKVRGRGLLAGLGIFAGGELAYSALFGLLGWKAGWCLQISRVAYFSAVYVWIDHLLRPDQPLPISREAALRLLRRMRDILAEGDANNKHLEFMDL